MTTDEIDRPQKGQRRVIVILISLILGLIVIVLSTVIFRAIRSEIHALDNSLARSRAAKIRHMLFSFVEKRGEFPRRTIRSEKTGAIASWPVILEAFDDNDYGYDFDEPWDSSHNISVASRPQTVVYPSKNISGLGILDFATVSDLPTVLSDARVTPDTITDGPANTLVAAQLSSASARWSQPTTMSFDEFVFNCTTKGELKKGNVGFAEQILIFADFDIYFVVRPIPFSYFRALWTCNGKDGISRSQLTELGYLVRYY